MSSARRSIVADNITRAVAQLFDRKSAPKPRQGKTQESAIAAIRLALGDAGVGGAIAAIIHDDDGAFVRRTRDLARRAETAAKNLDELVKALVRNGNWPRQSPIDPALLARTLADAMGLAQRDHFERLTAGVAAIIFVQAFTASIERSTNAMANQIAGSRQNLGKVEDATTIKELALVWVDVTGQPPGKKKDQNGTPFGKFVSIIFASSIDQSRLINRAIAALTENDIAQARAGYRHPIADDPEGDIP